MDSDDGRRRAVVSNGQNVEAWTPHRQAVSSQIGGCRAAEGR